MVGKYTTGFNTKDRKEKKNEMKKSKYTTGFNTKERRTR